jgi:hypothetical protein
MCKVGEANSAVHQDRQMRREVTPRHHDARDSRFPRGIRSLVVERMSQRRRVILDSVRALGDKLVVALVKGRLDGWKLVSETQVALKSFI